MSKVRVNNSARRPLRMTAAAALAVLVLGSMGSAFAAAAPTASGDRVLGVSIPPDPLDLKPGDTKTIDVKITNAGSTPFRVTIEGRALDLGDDGAVSVGTGSDEQWRNQVDFPRDPLTIPAQGWKDAAVTIRMPAVIEPDTYLVGFVVSPVPSADGSVKVVNQVATFLTVDVPGPRNRKVRADFDAPGFIFGTKAEGKVRVRNTGRVATRFWAETDVTSSPGGGAPKQGRLDKTLLPAGRAKSFSITGSPHYPIGFVTMKVRVTYPGTTDTSTRDVVVTHRILVIHPIVVYGALALLGVLVVWFVRRRVRRRRARTGAARGRQRGAESRATRRVARPAPTPSRTEPRRTQPRRVESRRVESRRVEPRREPTPEEPEPDTSRVVRRARRSGFRRWFGGPSAPSRTRAERARTTRAPAPTTVGSRRSRRSSRRR
jgi:hypothetical protein